uniref:Uncharacterized protein n=1 Tax=Romanomermis culicivorax TaxID=13658 RepID=A0A915JN36_ROMCU
MDSMLTSAAEFLAPIQLASSFLAGPVVKDPGLGAASLAADNPLYRRPLVAINMQIFPTE